MARSTPGSRRQRSMKWRGDWLIGAGASSGVVEVDEAEAGLSVVVGPDRSPARAARHAPAQRPLQPGIVGLLQGALARFGPVRPGLARTAGGREVEAADPALGEIEDRQVVRPQSGGGL